MQHYVIDPNMIDSGNTQQTQMTINTNNNNTAGTVLPPSPNRNHRNNNYNNHNNNGDSNQNDDSAKENENNGRKTRLVAGRPSYNNNNNKNNNNGCNNENNRNSMKNSNNNNGWRDVSIMNADTQLREALAFAESSVQPNNTNNTNNNNKQAPSQNKRPLSEQIRLENDNLNLQAQQHQQHQQHQLQKQKQGKKQSLHRNDTAFTGQTNNNGDNTAVVTVNTNPNACNYDARILSCFRLNVRDLNCDQLGQYLNNLKISFLCVDEYDKELIETMNNIIIDGNGIKLDLNINSNGTCNYVKFYQISRLTTHVVTSNREKLVKKFKTLFENNNQIKIIDHTWLISTYFRNSKQDSIQNRSIFNELLFDLRRLSNKLSLKEKITQMIFSENGCLLHENASENKSDDGMFDDINTRYLVTETVAASGMHIMS